MLFPLPKGLPESRIISQFPTVGLRYLALYEKYIDDGHYLSAPAQINISWEQRSRCREVYVEVCHYLGITLDSDSRDDIIEPSVNEPAEWMGGSPIPNSLRPSSGNNSIPATISEQQQQQMAKEDKKFNLGVAGLRSPKTSASSLQQKHIETHHKLSIRDTKEKPPSLHPQAKHEDANTQQNENATSKSSSNNNNNNNSNDNGNSNKIANEKTDQNQSLKKKDNQKLKSQFNQYPNTKVDSDPNSLHHPDHKRNRSIGSAMNKHSAGNLHPNSQRKRAATLDTLLLNPVNMKHPQKHEGMHVLEVPQADQYTVRIGKNSTTLETIMDTRDGGQASEVTINHNETKLLASSHMQHSTINVDDSGYPDEETDGIVEMTIQGSTSHSNQDDFFARNSRMDIPISEKISATPDPSEPHPSNNDKIIDKELSELEDKFENVTGRSNFSGIDTQRTNDEVHASVPEKIVTEKKDILGGKSSNTLKKEEEEKNNTSRSRTMSASPGAGVAAVTNGEATTLTLGNREKSPDPELALRQSSQKQQDSNPTPHDIHKPTELVHMRSDVTVSGNQKKLDDVFSNHTNTTDDKQSSDHKMTDDELAVNTYRDSGNTSDNDPQHLDTTFHKDNTIIKDTMHLTVRNNNLTPKQPSRPSFQNLRSITVYFMGKGNDLKPSQKALSKNMMSAAVKDNIEDMPIKLVHNILNAIDRSLAEVYTNLRDPFTRFQKTKVNSPEFIMLPFALMLSFYRFNSNIILFFVVVKIMFLGLQI
ncbi:hypothetical protein RFI_28180 [Reticulomyxa filosa]|uniref:Uncharacterized protein n=1 Tax=Reticulomyxa filosa TaxID=46433 RepID=X6M5E7_RETFI|nr:hypothetical protein RFI_28180 [Reticulomyxa filosa]|eukprot:ETO09208.1 hypothetical protein RFI_28180 [Reticulomyxa filosa]